MDAPHRGFFAAPAGAKRRIFAFALRAGQREADDPAGVAESRSIRCAMLRRRRRREP
jgi:hypothetical protein